ncbi:MAG: ABC transporter permease [Bacillota bacterium]|nr:MAG: ABC transporter permease [Bacillota bacterium]
MAWFQLDNVRPVARYQWTRLRRTWLLPVAPVGGLAVGLLTTTQTVAVTGAGVLQQAAYFLSLLHLGVMVLTALAIYPEADEDSTELLWTWPVDNISLILGKFAGVAPLAGLAALGAFLLPAVLMVRFWWGSGLSLGYLAAELGLLALWLGTGALFAAAMGGALGLWARGWRLYVPLFVVWLAGTIGPNVIRSTVDSDATLWHLFQWSLAELLVDDEAGSDFYALLPHVGVIIAHRLTYACAALLLAVAVALGYRRTRRLGRPAPRWLGTLAGALVLATVALALGTVVPMERRAGVAHQEMVFYLDRGRHGGGTSVTLSQENSGPGLHRLHIPSYDLQVDASQPPLLRVDAEFILEYRGDKPLSRPQLGLRHDFQIDALYVDGELARFSRSRDALYLEEVSLAPGQSVRVRLTYHGRVEAWRFRHEWGARAGTMFLQAVDLRAFVRREGLYLPASYGWYPLPADGPLAEVLALPFGHGYWFWEGPDRTSAGVLRPPGSVPPSRERSPYDWLTPTSDTPATFRVRVRRAGSYPVLSNLQDSSDPRAPTVSMLGRSNHLTLIGWPLAVAHTEAGSIYHLAENRGALERGRRILETFRDSYRRFGQAVPRLRVVTLRLDPNVPWIVDPYTGVVLDHGYRGSPVPRRDELLTAVLAGAREPSPAEECLVSSLVRFDHSQTSQADHPLEGLVGDYCQGLQGGPTTDAVVRWLERARPDAVRKALATLHQIARQRPLTAEDLREVLGL